MKTLLFLVILVAGGLLLPSAAAENPTVMVTGYTISPQVVMPSEPVSITVTLTHTAQQASRTSSLTSGSEPSAPVTESLMTPVNAYIESAIMKSTDFQILNGWYEDVGEIGPGQSLNLTFFLTAPPRQGVFFPEAWIRIRDSGSVKYPVMVNVNTPFALSRMPSFRIDRRLPDQVTPGLPFDIRIDLTNEGDARAHDISLSVNTPDQSVSSLTPEQFYIRDIGPGDSSFLNLSFVTDTDIPIGILQIPLTLRFRTTDSTLHEQEAEIGVLVLGKGEPGVSKYQLTPQEIRVGDTFSLILRIENTGSGDAKSVRVSLDIPFDGITEAFVGTIEPDKDAPAVFTLTATQAGEIPYNLTIRYTDDYGTHTTTEPLVLQARDRDGNGIIILLVLIFLAGAAAVAYKRWNRP